jgi:O-antigen/teichoic acid export membrane protein
VRPKPVRDRSLDPTAVSAAQLLAGKIAGNAGYFVAVLVLARSLGPSGRGEIAFLIVVSLVLARLSALGAVEATTIFASRRPQIRAAQLSTVVAFAAAGSAVASALAGGILLVLDAGGAAAISTTECLVLVAATIAVAVGDAGFGYLLGCERIREQALITAASPWAYALLLAAVWASGGVTVVRAALAWAIAHVLRAAWVLRRSVEVAGFSRPSLQLLLESMSFGVRAWSGTLARFLNFRADQVLMGFIATESTLGVYAVAVNAAEVLLYVPSTMALALLPVVSRSEPTARVALVLRAFRSAALVTLAGTIFAALLGPVLLPFVFGKEFEASVTPFLLLLPGAVGFVAMAVFSSGLAASSSPGRSSVGPVVSLVLGVALALALIPPHGASGAAAAASVAFLAGGTASIALYRRRSLFDWSLLLLPRRGDLDVLLALARAFRRAQGVPLHRDSSA